MPRRFRRGVRGDGRSALQSAVMVRGAVVQFASCKTSRRHLRAVAPRIARAERMARVVLLLCGMAGALHDPVTVIPRGRRRPSTPASDWALLVVAAIALFAVLAMVIPGVRSERA